MTSWERHGVNPWSKSPHGVNPWFNTQDSAKVQQIHNECNLEQTEWQDLATPSTKNVAGKRYRMSEIWCGVSRFGTCLEKYNVSTFWYKCWRIRVENKLFPGWLLLASQVRCVSVSIAGSRKMGQGGDFYLSKQGGPRPKTSTHFEPGQMQVRRQKCERRGVLWNG